MTRWHPLTALALTFLAAVLVLVVERTHSLVLLAVVGALYAFTGGAWRWWRWLLLLCAAATWSLALSQGMFYMGSPRTVLVQLLPPLDWLAHAPGGEAQGVYLYREGLLHGAVQSLRMHAMILLAAGLLARYSADRLALGLRAAGLPASVTFLAAMALRQVPVIAEEARVLWLAQRLRGMRLLFGPGSVAASPGRLLMPLLAGNLRRADEIAAALHARGFALSVLAQAQPERPPTRERILMWSVAAVVVLLLAAVTLARLQASGAFTLPGLAPVYAWVAAYV